MESQALDLGNACSGFDDAVLDELSDIAALYADASGLFLTLVTRAAAVAGSALDRLPAGWKSQLESVSELALQKAYDAAVWTHGYSASEGWISGVLNWASGETWHKVASSVTGALGGFGGIATTLIDLPVTTALILRSVQEIAQAYGEDLSDPKVRAQCMAVFAMAGPLDEDDSSDLGLWGARLALSREAVAQMIKAVAPRFGIVVSQKVLAQATPIAGAVAGAAVNPIFAGFFQTMAHVHFRLRKVERDHDPQQVAACFERIVRTSRRRARSSQHRSAAG